MRLRAIAPSTQGIRRKIFFICGILVIPLFASTVATTLMVRGIEAQAKKLQQDTLPVIENYEELRLAGLRVIETTNTYALINTLGRSQGQEQNSFSVDKRAELNKSRDEFAEALQAIQIMQDEDGGGTDRIRRNVEFTYRDILKQSDKIIELVARNAGVNVLLSSREKFENSAVNFRNLIGMAIRTEKEELEQRQVIPRERMTSILTIVSAIGAAGILLALGAGYHLSRRLAKPIHQLRDAVRQVGDGDFDALKQSPLQARIARDEINDLVQAFGGMSDRLRQLLRDKARDEKLTMLGQVAATVSHELRNPLGTIRTTLAVVRQTTSGTGLNLDRSLERADRAIGRCDGLIADMLEYTRLRDMNRQLTAFDPWLSEFLEEYARPPAIMLRRDLRAASMVALDGDRFQQVLINLLDNAVQALTDPAWKPETNRKRQITVRTEVAGPYLRLSIHDTGPGIAPDAQSRIFEPLFTTKNFGVGLGLPTVRKIVEQHGGTIAVERTGADGTEFAVWLPRLAERGEIDAQAAVA
jgi:signal transduction histidine kinase